MSDIDSIFDKETQYDFAIFRMCDLGVRDAVKRGGIWFKIMECEADKVRHYMAKRHPGVEYQMSWPSWQSF